MNSKVALLSELADSGMASGENIDSYLLLVVALAEALTGILKNRHEILDEDGQTLLADMTEPVPYAWSLSRSAMASRVDVGHPRQA